MAINLSANGGKAELLVGNTVNLFAAPANLVLVASNGCTELVVENSIVLPAIGLTANLIVEENQSLVLNGGTVSIEGSGGSFASYTITQLDASNATYYYYGGIDASNNWVILRYVKANLLQRSKATNATNSIYSDLAAAWNNRLSLNYS